MTNKLNAIKEALWDKLTGDTTLMTDVSGVWDTVAPEESSYPFVLFQQVSSVPHYALGVLVGETFDFQITVHGVAERNAPSQQVLARAADRIDALLTLQPLAVTGQRCEYVRRTGNVPDRVEDLDTGKLYMTTGAQYELWIGA